MTCQASLAQPRASPCLGCDNVNKGVEFATSSRTSHTHNIQLTARTAQVNTLSGIFVCRRFYREGGKPNFQEGIRFNEYH
jgi:hypothetical protein